MMALSLIFSCLVWGLMKLSDTYSAVYHYRVEVSTNLPGREFTSISDGPLSVIGSSSGYKLFNHRVETKQNKNIVYVNVEPFLVKKVRGSDEQFYILVNSISSKLKEKVVNEKVNFESFSTDTLFFKFKKVSTKRVKVALKSRFSFAKEYMPVEKITVNPDSIDIQGVESLIKTIDSIQTEVVKRVDVKDNIQGVIGLKPIDRVVFSHSEIYFSQLVGRYYESQTEIPVVVKKMPTGKNIEFYPKSVIVTYRALYNSKAMFGSDDFEASIDFTKISDPLSKGVDIMLTKVPNGVISAKINHLFIDNYIISDVN